jgi:hypothetical protein
MHLDQVLNTKQSIDECFIIHPENINLPSLPIIKLKGLSLTEEDFSS